MNEKRGYDLIAADVVLAQKGDAEAMERILADVQDSVYYNCRTMLHDEQAAQDATQDILITVYRKIGTVSDPKAYIGWVRRITANHCKNRLCKVNREFLMPAAEDDKDPFAAFEDTDEQRVPEKAFDNEETRRMVVDLVNKLPDEQRMCVMLFYYDELKTREIAETLSVSEGTVKSRLNYARKAIKEGVRDYEKKGVKLYGLSPIPFLGYFLGKTAAATTAPIVLANVTAAATAATAAAGAAAAGGTATAASASATAASGGLAAFLTTTAGKIAAGVRGRVRADRNADGSADLYPLAEADRSSDACSDAHARSDARTDAGAAGNDVSAVDRAGRNRDGLSAELPDHRACRRKRAWIRDRKPHCGDLGNPQSRGIPRVPRNGRLERRCTGVGASLLRRAPCGRNGVLSVPWRRTAQGRRNRA